MQVKNYYLESDYHLDGSFRRQQDYHIRNGLISIQSKNTVSKDL